MEAVADAGDLCWIAQDGELGGGNWDRCAVLPGGRCARGEHGAEDLVGGCRRWVCPTRSCNRSSRESHPRCDRSCTDRGVPSLGGSCSDKGGPLAGVLAVVGTTRAAVGLVVG